MLTGIFMCVNLPEMICCQRAPGCFTHPSMLGWATLKSLLHFDRILWLSHMPCSHSLNVEILNVFQQNVKVKLSTLLSETYLVTTRVAVMCRSLCLHIWLNYHVATKWERFSKRTFGGTYCIFTRTAGISLYEAK